MVNINLKASSYSSTSTSTKYWLPSTSWRLCHEVAHDNWKRL